MVEQLDQQLDGFFTWLDQNVDGGLRKCLDRTLRRSRRRVHAGAGRIAGHGSATWDIPKLIAGLNDAMNGKFSPGEKIDYLLTHQELPYIQLNQPAFERAGINEQEAEDAITAAIPAVVSSLPAQPPIHPPIGTPPPIVQAPRPNLRRARGSSASRSTAAGGGSSRASSHSPPQRRSPCSRRPARLPRILRLCRGLYADAACRRQPAAG